MLTGGQMADCTAGAQLLERLPPCRILHGDKGYDTDAIRRQIEATGDVGEPDQALVRGAGLHCPNRNLARRIAPLVSRVLYVRCAFL